MGDLFDRLLLLLREQGVEGLIATALPRLNETAAVGACCCRASVHADRRITPGDQPAGAARGNDAATERSAHDHWST